MIKTKFVQYKFWRNKCRPRHRVVIQRTLCYIYRAAFAGMLKLCAYSLGGAKQTMKLVDVLSPE